MPRVRFDNVSPLAISIGAVDSYPNTWEHYSNPSHDVLPSSDTPAYKYHVRIPMAAVQTNLMATSQIEFDTNDFTFLEPQPPNVITLVTRMCSFFFVFVTPNRSISCALHSFSIFVLFSRSYI